MRPITPATLFSNRSDLYAVGRPGYPPELFEYLASLCHSHDCAWDCATGSGQAARSLIQYFSSVQATDISESQLQHAIQHEQIQYSVQRAEHTNFAKHQFDLIAVAQALHWFNLPRFWQEVDRVLTPKGILAIWGYGWLNIHPDIDQRLEETLYQRIHPYWASENKILWNGYNTINFPVPLLPTPSYELQLNWNLDQLFKYLQTWSAVRRCIATEGQDFLTEAIMAIGTVWGKSNNVKVISMDLVLKVGRKE